MNPAANFSGVDYLLIHGTADGWQLVVIIRIVSQ